jgi:hypothetical protein
MYIFVETASKQGIKSVRGPYAKKKDARIDNKGVMGRIAFLKPQQLIYELVDDRWEVTMTSRASWKITTRG